jgi:hypothetical protein
MKTSSFYIESAFRPKKTAQSLQPSQIGIGGRDAAAQCEAFREARRDSAPIILSLVLAAYFETQAVAE